MNEFDVIQGIIDKLGEPDTEVTKSDWLHIAELLLERIQELEKDVLNLSQRKLDKEIIW